MTLSTSNPTPQRPRALLPTLFSQLATLGRRLIWNLLPWVRSAETIQAAVSPKMLSKVDRLFSNRLSDIIIELLQNARRAGATRVEVTTETIAQGTRIRFADDGEGIEDFRVLLHLGDSNWDRATSEKEDPAGMGMFSLLHSGVTIRSRGQEAVITKAGFLGSEPVEVVKRAGSDRGTVLIFDRPEDIRAIEEALKRVALYGALEVYLNDTLVPRKDFLEESVFVKEVSGVRIGVHTDYFASSWNFYGRVIEGRRHLPSLSRVTIDDEGKRRDLYVRVDVKEARHIHLKLPDRTEIVEDDSYVALCREAKITLYEYLATLPEHVAKFSDFVEARSLGVELKEATPWFTTFYKGPAWEGTDDAMFSEKISVIATEQGHAIVEGKDDNAEMMATTFMIAGELFHELPVVALDDVPDYKGYSWYDSIPRLRGFSLAIDGNRVGKSDSYPVLSIADSIQLYFSLDRNGSEEPFVWDLPFAGFRGGDWSEETVLVIAKNSPWTRSHELSKPFDLVDAAIYIAFSPSDGLEADSSDTQLDSFRNNVQSEIISILGGALALIKHEVNEALFGWRTDVSGLLRRENVSEIRVRKTETGRWETELITSAP